MLSCREATRLLSEARERELGLSERVSLAFHTAMCSGCRHFGRQMPLMSEAMRRFAGGAGDDTPPPDPEIVPPDSLP